jgi:5-hydroxyisourate hydrolase
MSGITSHVLDTSRGKPAEGITIQLEFKAADNQWQPIKQDVTDSDGRVASLVDGSPEMGDFRISFLVDDYFRRHDVEAFYPIVQIEFKVGDADQHYHVPLLLNPFGYSTYRGS